MTEHSRTSKPQKKAPEAGRRNTILVVDDHPLMRKMLVDLINDKTDAQFCLEADSTEIASTTLDHEAVDFALLDISANPDDGVRSAELLKLRCPMLPVMAVCISNKGEIGGTRNTVFSGEQTERILASVRYMQSLVRCGLSGFTVFVKIENGL